MEFNFHLYLLFCIQFSTGAANELFSPPFPTARIAIPCEGEIPGDLTKRRVGKQRDDCNNMLTKTITPAGVLF